MRWKLFSSTILHVSKLGLEVVNYLSKVSHSTWQSQSFHPNLPYSTSSNHGTMLPFSKTREGTTKVKARNGSWTKSAALRMKNWLSTGLTQTKRSNGWNLKSIIFALIFIIFFLSFFTLISFKVLFVYRERVSGGGAEKGRDRIRSRLCAVSAKPKPGLQLRNYEMMTYPRSRVGRLTDWAHPGNQYFLPFSFLWFLTFPKQCKNHTITICAFCVVCLTSLHV